MLLMKKILIACQEEGLPILGLLGPWDFCQNLWNLFREKAIILPDTFISKEILYYRRPLETNAIGRTTCKGIAA